MKLLMHILKKNDKLNIDNRTLGIVNISDKLREEYEELQRAINIYRVSGRLKHLKEVIRETFDLIQICILILWRCNRKALDFDEPNLLEELNIEHKNKLVSERHWIPETGIEIDIKE